MRNFANRYQKILPHYRDTPEKRYFKITIFLIIGAILLMVLSSLIAFSLAIKGPEEVLVPNVVGRVGDELDLIAAMKKLQEKSLYAEIQLKHSSYYKRGTIIEQRPRSGSIVKAGRRVLLTVSEGPVVSSVGNYIGKAYAAVKIELQEIFSGEGDALIQIKKPVMHIFDNSAVDTVLEQNPAPGTGLRENEIIYLDLVVSKGPKGEQFLVPAYVGRNFENVLNEMALSDIPFTFRIRPAQENEKYGVIVSQFPKAGDEVRKNLLIELTMTKPVRLEEGLEFSSVKVDLPQYPILVKIELVERDGSDRRTIFSMMHPGGSLNLPYIAKESASVIFLVNGTPWSP